jgi:hypothetical protein
MVGCPQGEIEDRNHRGCDLAVSRFPLTAVSRRTLLESLRQISRIMQFNTSIKAI